MQAYEGFIENGKIYPIGEAFSMTGRHRVLITVIDDVAENSEKMSNVKYLSLIDEFYGSINDSTFSEPLEIPWEHGFPREGII